MNPEDLEARNELLLNLTERGGELARDLFRDLGKLTVEYKGLQDTVSEADREVERFIRNGIAERFPDDVCFGEEYGLDETRDGALYWVIDPIDGTNCFLSGIKTWCTTVALTDGKEIFSGAVFSPENREFFHAVKGGGAFLNGERIRCNPEISFDRIKFGLGYKHSMDRAEYLKLIDHVISAGGSLYANGSAALMCCYAACSRIGTLYEGHVNSYDCLAGILIAEECGCAVNDFLADDGLRRGNRLLICAPQLWDLNRRITGVER